MYKLHQVVYICCFQILEIVITARKVTWRGGILHFKAH